MQPEGLERKSLHTVAAISSTGTRRSVAKSTLEARPPQCPVVSLLSCVVIALISIIVASGSGEHTLYTCIGGPNRSGMTVNPYKVKKSVVIIT